jgi:hypothetical protein
VRLLLSEPLPLRTTAVLGDFAEARPLPHRYGDLTAARFPLVRITDVEFFVADHPMTVSGVFVDGEVTRSWEQATDTDDGGHAWTVVRFTAPIATGSAVSATGTGKRSAATGELIENPADLMADVAALAGMSLTFPDLRGQAAAEGLRLAGSVDEAASVRAVLDDIARSCGALWTPSGGRLYPATAVVGAVFDLEADAAGGLDFPQATLDDTADVLRVAYDRADATGRMQRYLELTASPQLYGGVVADVALPWLRTAANAEAVGRRLLARMAGRRYRVSFTVDRHDIRPAQWVHLIANPEWQLPGADPFVMVLEVEVEPDAKSSRLTGEALLSVPSATITGHSVGLPDTTEGGADVEFRDGVATFTIRDEDGRPLRGALVTLDGADAKRTDERGQVSFTTVPGPHILLIERDGFQTQQIEFEL